MPDKWSGEDESSGSDNWDSSDEENVEKKEGEVKGTNSTTVIFVFKKHLNNLS
jgi:hypothetical protein